MKRTITFLCLFLVSSCGFVRSEIIGKELETQIKKNNWERVDLSQVGGSAWQRVCIFQPYSNNDLAKQTLGFEWDLEQKTSISSSDSMNLLVFVEGKEVITYVEHPRNLGDFEGLSGQCFDREDAKFARDKTRKDDWVSFVTEK